MLGIFRFPLYVPLLFVSAFLVTSSPCLSFESKSSRSSSHPLTSSREHFAAPSSDFEIQPFGRLDDRGRQDLLEEGGRSVTSWLRRSLLQGDSLKEESQKGATDLKRRMVIAITPTWRRAFQALYINNLVATLRAAGPPLLWIIVEGAQKTEETTRLLEKTAARCLPLGDPNCEAVNYVHLTAGKNETSRWNKAVVQRNAGLEYVERNRIKGTIYFMDDDNTYSPLLLEELRRVRRVGVFPVGFLFSHEFAIRNPYLQHHPTVERPLVRARPGDPEGRPQVYGWETFEWSIPKKHGGAPRTFCTDMAGFALNSELLWTKLPERPDYPKHPVRFSAVSGGYLETIFLGKIVPGLDFLEPLCDMARQVLVWHTHGEAEKWYHYPEFWKLPQPRPEDLVKIETDGTTWTYVIGQDRYGIRGSRDTDVRPGYRETGYPAPEVKA